MSFRCNRSYVFTRIVEGLFMSQHEQRNRLLERARNGEITGAEADAEAVKLGLGRLSHEPGLDEFRPESMSHWTLTMAVAWIAYADLEKVREWSTPYRQACFDWVWQRWQQGIDGPIIEGWELEQRRKPRLALLSLHDAHSRADHPDTTALSIADARKALWAALADKMLIASGIATGPGRRIEIPAVEWLELDPYEMMGFPEEVRLRPAGSGYRDVLLPSLDLRRIWGPRPKAIVTLPETQTPLGDGFMPLYCAAQWIATHSGTIDFNPENTDIWRLAFDELTSAIAADKVRVVGSTGGMREIIGGHHFAGIRVDYPFSTAELDLMLGTDTYLRSHPYLDEEHWRNGFDDALVCRRKPHWTLLMVDKAHVRALWAIANEHTTTTGLPGRPALSRHLILDELRRRSETEALSETLKAQAEALQVWLRDHYPANAPPTVKTIENSIRTEYWRLKPTK